MRLCLTVSSFLAIATILCCAAADDLNALKDTLQKLCDANKNGEFGYCCTKNNNGQDITDIDALPSCFGRVSATSGTIQYLFASRPGRSPFFEDIGKPPTGPSQTMN